MRPAVESFRKAFDTSARRTMQPGCTDLGHHFIFIGGLHRSGTTPLQRIIATHPLISGFHDTGVPGDEGQFLQDIYPVFPSGGAGILGLRPDGHMTETSPLIAAAKAGLFRAWMPYWDLTKPFLVEKTPSNLIRARFLQEVFPNSAFIFMIRHPVASVMATLKLQNRASVREMIKSWIICHNIMLNDLAYLRRQLVIRYERLCEHPKETISTIGNFIGASGEMVAGPLEAGLNDLYFAQWRKGDYRFWRGRDHWIAPLRRWCNLAESAYLSKKYERDINKFGYSFDVCGLPGKADLDHPC